MDVGTWGALDLSRGVKSDSITFSFRYTPVRRVSPAHAVQLLSTLGQLVAMRVSLSKYDEFGEH